MSRESAYGLWSPVLLNTAIFIAAVLCSCTCGWLKEEQEAVAEFGEAYGAYARNPPRWIPCFSSSRAERRAS